VGELLAGPAPVLPAPLRTPCAGVIAFGASLLHELKQTQGVGQTMSDPHGFCRPALTLRWPKIHGASLLLGYRSAHLGALES